jgi:hypothetical protein
LVHGLRKLILRILEILKLTGTETWRATTGELKLLAFWEASTTGVCFFHHILEER